jgi:hypothetical protein
MERRERQLGKAERRKNRRDKPAGEAELGVSSDVPALPAPEKADDGLPK